MIFVRCQNNFLKIIKRFLEILLIIFSGKFFYLNFLKIQLKENIFHTFFSAIPFQKKIFVEILELNWKKFMGEKGNEKDNFVGNFFK